MNFKFIIIILIMAGIVSLAMFGSGLKGIAVKGIAKDLPEYNCGEGNICTSCIIEGQTCGCGTEVCDCGNKTINKEECGFFNKF